ncbi:hypothetical protein CRUP_030301, partial [Coryphaenoides rupestris]
WPLVRPMSSIRSKLHLPARGSASGATSAAGPRVNLSPRLALSMPPSPWDPPLERPALVALQEAPEQAFSLFDEDLEEFQMLQSPTTLPPLLDIPSKELRHATREETGDILERLTCPVPGWFRCQRTGLVLRGCGELVYRVLALDRDFLYSRGRAALMVVHVTGSGVEFLTPRGVSEVTASVAITGFSGYALVRPISRSPAPIHGLVLLFHQTGSEPELCSSLFLLLLPRNVVIAEVPGSPGRVQYDRYTPTSCDCALTLALLQVIKMWKMRSMAQYIETLNDCVLVPNQTYRLSGDPVQLVQPQNAEFLNFDDYDNYCASFEAHLARGTRHVELCLESPAWGCRRLLQWLLPSKSSVVWRKSVKIQGKCSVLSHWTPQHAAEDLKVKEALLDALNQLSITDFHTFQTRLRWHDNSIPCSSLEGAERITTVDIMTQKYLPSGAKKITIDVLKSMNLNDLAVRLESAE